MNFIRKQRNEIESKTNDEKIINFIQRYYKQLHTFSLDQSDQANCFEKVILKILISKNKLCIKKCTFKL
jgi:hypothetical protein